MLNGAVGSSWLMKVQENNFGTVKELTKYLWMKDDVAVKNKNKAKHTDRPSINSVSECDCVKGNVYM